MNRSEEKQRVQELLQEYSLSELVAHTIEEERENDQLKERLDKAIEYIEQLTNDEESIELMDINSLVQKELLEILKGDSNESI